MRHSRTLSIIPWFALAACLATAASLKTIDTDWKPSPNKNTVVYKSTPEGDLTIDLYFPHDWKAGDRRPAIVFFFGGGFTSGSTAQFSHTAEYFATRGMVGATADYRVTVKSAKDSVATVEVLEERGGEWTLLSSSVPGERVSSTRTRFRLRVPAKGEAVLTYRVRVVW